MFQHFGVAFKRGGLLCEYLVFLTCQRLFAFAPFVDFGDFLAMQTSLGAQPMGAQHVVEISDIVEVVHVGVSPESAEPKQAFVPSFQVSGEEMDVAGHALKQGPRHLTAEHGDVQIGILRGQIIDHGHRHGDVAQGREPYDEEFLHFCP